jgi:NAD+ synthase (glutamine-hydrolysing)
VRSGQADDRRSFFSIHAQGLVRVAAATPAASAGDPAANAARFSTWRAGGMTQSADLIVFPNWR